MPSVCRDSVRNGFGARVSRSELRKSLQAATTISGYAPTAARPRDTAAWGMPDLSATHLLGSTTVTAGLLDYAPDGPRPARHVEY